MSDEKSVNIKSDEIKIDDQGRVVITNQAFKDAIEKQMKSGKKAKIMGNANCMNC